jgi:hypothetical protein
MKQFFYKRSTNHYLHTSGLLSALVTGLQTGFNTTQSSGGIVIKVDMVIFN